MLGWLIYCMAKAPVWSYAKLNGETERSLWGLVEGPMPPAFVGNDTPQGYRRKVLQHLEFTNQNEHEKFKMQCTICSEYQEPASI